MEDFSELLLERIALRLKAMANPFRLRILHALEAGERSVNEILEQVGGSQGNVSKHLGVLHRAELVKRRREGTNIFYAVSDEAVFDVCRTVCDSLHARAAAEVEAIERARAEILGVGSDAIQ
jgi:DNA-binding transcriptional ArsR family regulator